MSLPPLHVVVPDRVAAAGGFLAAASGLLERHGDRIALHLRLKETPARRLHELAAELSRRARRHGGWCVVNERVDVAMTAGAQAVQLGAGALPTPRARELLGRDVAVGVSVHGPEEARRAADEGANHLVVGTIFDSASHPDRPGAGPDLLEACRGRVDLPLVAIGGVTPGRVAEVLDAGARGVAALSAVWEADRPSTAVQRFVESLAAAEGG